MNQSTKSSLEIAAASSAEWLSLVQEGLSGNAPAFRLRLTRVISRLRRERSPLADTLAQAMAQAPLGHGLDRDAAPVAAQRVEPVDHAGRLSLTTFEFPVVLETTPVWTAGVAKGLRDVVEEWQHARQLAAAGLDPSKTVLLSGPPGVGKTLAARHLAATLELPLLTLDLAAAISSHLGQTGANLAQVLSRGQRERCVLFLDEFDALAKSRGDTQDVGELKRVVNVLLQSIDRWPSTSLLVAATNHADLLDHAIFRRFDLWIQFEPSSRAQVRELAISHGCPSVLLDALVDRLAGRPLSDTVKVLEKARRLSLLRGMPPTDALRESLASLYPDVDGQPLTEDPRAADARRLNAQGLSQRAIAIELGISHSTVHRLLKTTREQGHG